MSELSSDARALIEEGRVEHGPSEGDRARIRAKLVRELGAGAFAGAAVLGAASLAGAPVGKSATALWLKAAAKLVAVAGAAGTLYVGASLATRSGDGAGSEQRASRAPSSRQAAPSVAPVEQPPAVDTAAADAPVEGARRAAESARSVPSARRGDESTPRARSRRRVQEAPVESGPEALEQSAEPARPVLARSTLADELALLGEAQRALRERQPERALSLAGRHASAFPSGTLGEERYAIETLARCMLGLASAQEVNTFLARAPGSPLAARVREECKAR